MADEKLRSCEPGMKMKVDSPKTPKTPSPRKNINPVADPSIKKRTKDLIIDLHEYIQLWETLNQKSFQGLNSLTNIWTQLKSSEEEYERDKTVVEPDCWKRYKMKILKLRESLIDDHQQDIKQFEGLYLKMKKIIGNLEAISFMGLMSFEERTDGKKDGHALFNTWTAQNFHQSARSIFNSFTKEWLFKQGLSGRFLSIDSKTEMSQFTLLVSMWLQQPYIEDNVDMELQKMLIESGIKS